MPYLSIDRARRAAGREGEAWRPSVLTRPAGGVEVVVEVCPQARALGVRPAMTIGQARASVPTLRTWPYAAHQNQVWLERLAGWALRFSPIVEPVYPNTLLLDITGCARLFGGEEHLAKQAVAGLARSGLQVRAAVADTVGAAWALAVNTTSTLSIVPVGQTSAWLAPLPPAALRIDARLAEQLDMLGIRTIGDLLMLPRATLPARFGSQLVLRVQQALGEVFEGVVPYRPPDIPMARQIFDGPLAEPLPLRAVIERLLTELLEPLRRSGRGLRRLACVLYRERAAPLVIVLSLTRTCRDTGHVGALLWPRLERTDLSAGIVGVTLLARRTEAFGSMPGDLFDRREPMDIEAWGNLIDRLVARLGCEAVVRPRLLDDYQPERAFRYVTVAQTGGAPEEPSAGTPQMVLPPRPVRLLPRPWPVSVLASAPDGPPVWLTFRGRGQTVVGACGPERLETGWWRGADIRRDYFRVTIDTGEQYWVFRDLNTGRWYLHGLFA